MKQHTIYECEKCGKQSNDREEIMICEAAHFGLTVAEKQEWERLKNKVIYEKSCSFDTINEYTRKELENDISKLMNFEKLHGLNQS